MTSVKKSTLIPLTASSVALADAALSGGNEAGVEGVETTQTSGITIAGAGAGAVTDFSLGGNSTFFGVNAGAANISGLGCTCIGQGAGQSSVGGVSNTFVGNFAGRDVTTALREVFVGDQAGILTTTGGNNTFIGQQSGIDNTTGISNACLGTFAGAQLIGNENVVCGATGGGTTGMVAGDTNTLVGYKAGLNINGGDNNVIVGGETAAGLGATLTTGSNNVLIGSGANVDAAGRNGAVGIRVPTAAADDSFSCIRRVSAAGNAANFNGNELTDSGSSIKYKRDVRDYTPDLSKFSQLQPRMYKANPGYEEFLDLPDADHVGFIAEEVFEVYPEYCTYNDSSKAEIQGLNYDRMVALLIAKVKELDAEVKALKEA